MSYKKEVIDALEVYKRNTAHVLGDDSDMARAIDRCIALTNEVKVWTPVEEGLPKLVNTIDEMRYSDSVLCVDKEGVYVVCELWDDGYFCNEYGDKKDVVKWMELPKEDGK